MRTDVESAARSKSVRYKYPHCGGRGDSSEMQCVYSVSSHSQERKCVVSNSEEDSERETQKREHLIPSKETWCVFTGLKVNLQRILEKLIKESANQLCFHQLGKKRINSSYMMRHYVRNPCT